MFYLRQIRALTFVMRFQVADCFYFIFLWIIQIEQTFITYDFGALHHISYFRPETRFQVLYPQNIHFYGPKHVNRSLEAYYYFVGTLSWIRVNEEFLPNLARSQRASFLFKRKVDYSAFVFGPPTMKLISLKKLIKQQIVFSWQTIIQYSWPQNNN